MIDIKVLGTGCARCKQLYEEAEKAVAQAGLEAALSKVEKIDEILTYAVMATPALVVAGEVKCAGRIPKVPEIVTWLMNAAMKESP
jgi:small redox-active disulfide protein 2